ncbi:MAG: response regulator [SAR324 cluster bacterium]|nr:response regulator [SAR324 cluster bacterium]
MDKAFAADILTQYLDLEASIIFLLIDSKGVVLETNQYTKTMTGLDFSNQQQNLYDVLVDFGNLPSLEEIKNNSSVQMFNIQTSDNLPQTFYFNFFQKDDFTIVLGQMDQQETDELRNNLLQANNEANNLTRELQKKNAQLEQLNAVKNQFLGMAAHDLRNPIGIILRYSEFLIDEAKKTLTRDQLDLLNSIKISSNFMLLLLNDLLDIAKIESGKLELKLELTNFVEFVKRNISLNQIIASQKKIKLNFQSYEYLPQLMLDPLKMEQVFNNLISNAIKYSPANTSVLISVFQSGDYVMVSVKDQGPGIPEAEIPNLFKAFQTTSVQSTAGEKSTGLGLMIVNKIILGHQGRIWVESKQGEGSIFFFSLPMVLERTEKDSQALRQKSPAPKIRYNLAKKKPLEILLVDDQVEHMHMISILLNQLGYQAQFSRSARQALEEMGKNTFDIVFLDIKMPEIDGITMTEHLYRHHPRNKIPFLVAVTGAEISKEECLAAGFDEFLLKPIGIEDLQAAIGHVNIGSSAFTGEEVSKDKMSSPKPGPFLNLEVLEEYRKIDPEFLTALVSMFLEQTPGAIEELKKTFDENPRNIPGLVDQIQGACENLGATKLVKICQNIRESAPPAGGSEFERYLENLETAFLETKQALQQMKF